MKYRVLLIIVLLVLLIIVPAIIFNNKVNEDKLISKAASINVLMSEEKPNYDKVRKKLKTVVSNDKNRYVERAYNNYMLKVIDEIETIKTNIDTDKIYNLLDIKNIKEDGQEFKDTIKYTFNTKRKIKIYKTELNRLFTDKTIMSFLKRRRLKKELNIM